jgi:hypothetical protein
MRSIRSGSGAGHRAGHTRRASKGAKGRVVKGGVASALAVVGLVAFATPAFAHENIVSATASCANPAGSGYTIVWTIQNDFTLAEAVSVTSVTGGLSTLNSTTYGIAASPGQPYSSTTLTQTLPPSASGPITIDISSKWSDSFSTTDVGTYDLSQLHCAAPPRQTIAGHIYLCNNANPTTTEVSGGSLAASGPSPVSATPNPLAPTDVGAGGYTMTATAPPGYGLVVCTGSSTPSASGTTATEAVTVPSGGAGVGIFYVVASSDVATSPTTTSPGLGGSGTPGNASPSTSPSSPSTTPSSAATSISSLSPPALAFTGASLTWEWFIGLVLILLGSMLLALGGWHRRLGRVGWLGGPSSPNERPGFAPRAGHHATEPGKSDAMASRTIRSSRRSRLRRVLRY